MREIIFRGKCIDNGEWIFGVPIFDWYSGGKTANIINVGLIECCGENMVIPETISQYTGLKDKHGKMIFEGDVVRFLDTNYGYNDEQVVMYSAGYFSPLVRVEENHNALDIYEPEDYEIIGNIHDQREDV